MSNQITSQTTPITRCVDDMNISYSLYDTGDGEATYIIRDEDANEMVTRVDGPIEVVTLRYEIDIEKVN